MHSLNITAYNLENPKRKKQTDNSSPVDWHYTNSNITSCRQVNTYVADRFSQDLRVSATSIPAAAVAGAQFTKGNQLQVKFILQLSGLLTHIYNMENIYSHLQQSASSETDHLMLMYDLSECN